MTAWLPYFTLDLNDAALLPDGWDAAVRAMVDAPERHHLMGGDPATADGQPWHFAVVEGDVLRERLPWLWTLYHGAVRELAARAFGYPLFAANRLRATTTLNILSGVGASVDWHRDLNCVTAVLFVSAAAEVAGGDLAFRDGAGREAGLAPRPGLVVCFEGSIEHRIAALEAAGPRLSLVLLYYRSATDQPAAFGDNVYTLDSQSEPVA